MAVPPLQNRPCGGRYGDIVQAIGNTPLVELKRLERDHRAAISAGDGTAAGLRVKVDAAKQRWEELVSQSLEEAA